MSVANKIFSRLRKWREKLPMGRDENRIKSEELIGKIYEIESKIEDLNNKYKYQNQIIYNINKYTSKSPDPEKTYFGLNDLDKKLEKYLDYNNGFFVEIGANDGISQSNTLYFERNRGWAGVLIEPTPHNFLSCLANRSRKTAVFCRACVSFEYKDQFVEVAFSNLMSTPLRLDSDIVNPMAHAEKGRQFLQSHEEIFSFGALAAPLNTLLQQAGAPPSIDLLSLDVEGAEMEVLKGVDHNAFRFKYICVECRDIQRMKKYLEEIGYNLVEKLTDHDYLFSDGRE